MQEIDGIPASSGIVLGPDFNLRYSDISVLERLIDNVEIEEACLEKAVR